jgi:hypothetical protein
VGCRRPLTSPARLGPSSGCRRAIACDALNGFYELVVVDAPIVGTGDGPQCGAAVFSFERLDLLGAAGRQAVLQADARQGGGQLAQIARRCSNLGSEMAEAPMGGGRRAKCHQAASATDALAHCGLPRHGSGRFRRYGCSCARHGRAPTGPDRPATGSIRHRAVRTTRRTRARRVYPDGHRPCSRHLTQRTYRKLACSWEKPPRRTPRASLSSRVLGEAMPSDEALHGHLRRQQRDSREPAPGSSTSWRGPITLKNSRSSMPSQNADFYCLNRGVITWRPQEGGASESSPLSH